MTACKLYVVARNRLLCNILSVNPHILYFLVSYHFLLTSFILVFAA